MKAWHIAIDGWGNSLCQRIDLAALISRNPIAHKWKATYRSIVLRELTLWRVQDLLSQSFDLAKAGRMLGALVLLRSAYEALAILIYVNEKTRAVTEGTESFFVFDELTVRLMLGSKNASTSHESINVLTLLKHCEKRYPGIVGIFEALSECAHPNYEGLCKGFSSVDIENHVTEFRNRWLELDQGRYESGLHLCLQLFEDEYNDVWKVEFERLEKWLESNDSKLEAARRGT